MLLAAVSFLTVIPVGRRIAFSEREVTLAAPLFPLVGAAVGALVGAAAAALNTILPALLAAPLAVALGAAVTGCIHLDGLADTADALGGATREHALAIMRDHRIGTFGAVALVIDLVAKSASIGALTATWHIVPLLAAAGACSRLSPVLLASALAYAREGDGQGRILAGRTRPPVAGAALAVAVGLSLVVGHATGLAELAATAALTAGLFLFYRSWLGGVTGDTLGAATELSETAALIVATAIVS